MSGFILCQTKMAENPFYIENISTNIYSIEELCYYLCNNIYLIDETLFCEGLYQWISRELNLNVLGGKLRAIHGKPVGIEEYLFPIIKEINYLSYEELRMLSNRLQAYNREPMIIREKRKGDALVENGMYVRAIHTYENVLMGNMKGTRTGFEGSVWYNMGCTYSYLFQKKNALDCFEKAYWLLRTKASLKSYLYMYQELYTTAEYEKKLNEMGVDEKTRIELLEEKQAQITQNTEEITEEITEEKMEMLLENITREYHRNTGV